MPANTEPDKVLVLVKCFCRVMHCITWSEDQPSMPTACDGEAIGRAQLQMKKEVDD